MPWGLFNISDKLDYVFHQTWLFGDVLSSSPPNFFGSGQGKTRESRVKEVKTGKPGRAGSKWTSAKNKNMCFVTDGQSARWSGEGGWVLEPDGTGCISWSGWY